MKNKTLGIFSLLLVFGILLAGCGGDSSSTPSPGPTPPPSDAVKKPIILSDITLSVSGFGTAFNNDEQPPELAIEAESPDGGTLTYQWYQTEDPDEVGKAIVGENLPYFEPIFDFEGDMYFYVIVTNTLPRKGSASIPSGIVMLTVIPTDAPIIPRFEQGLSPVPVVYYAGAMPDQADDIILPLTVRVTQPPAGTTLSYHWHSNTTSNNFGGTEIAGNNISSYTPPIEGQIGTYYYYVVAQNYSADFAYSTVKNTNVAQIDVKQHIIPAQPTIATQPQLYRGYFGDTVTLNVLGYSTDADAVWTYQWYSTETGGIEGGKAIPNATNASYNPETDENTLGGKTLGYYCTVTSDIGDRATTKFSSKSVTSEVAIVALTVEGAAQMPAIGIPLVDRVEYKWSDILTAIENNEFDDLIAELTIGEATVTKGTITYQWYTNTVDSNQDGTPIDGATGPSYQPVPEDLPASGKDYYFYIVVTNTDMSISDTTKQVTTFVSKVAVIALTQPMVAATPAITKQPVGATYNYFGRIEGDVIPLTVEATAEDGGALSYQWYSNTADNTNGQVINGANGASYTPAPTSGPTTNGARQNVYYYVVVTNTNNLALNPTATRTSSVIVVELVGTAWPAGELFRLTLGTGENTYVLPWANVGASHTGALTFNTTYSATQKGTSMGRAHLTSKQYDNMQVKIEKRKDLPAAATAKVIVKTLPNTGTATATPAPVAADYNTIGADTTLAARKYSGKEFLQVQYAPSGTGTMYYYSIYIRRRAEIPYIADNIINIQDGSTNGGTGIYNEASWTQAEKDAWDSAEEFVIDRMLMVDSTRPAFSNLVYRQEDTSTIPRIKALWSDTGVYILARVQDKNPQLNYSGSNAHLADNMEVFISESFTIGDVGSWGAVSGASTGTTNGGQYRVNRNAVKSGDPATVTARITGMTYESVPASTGYTIKAKFGWQVAPGQANWSGKTIGFDLQIADSSASGNRDAVVLWNNFLVGSYQHRENAGIGILKAKP